MSIRAGSGPTTGALSFEIGPIVSVHHLSLADGLSAPARARSWLSGRLPRLPLPMVEDALLLVSELVTNAVRHGDPDITVAVAVSDETIRIEVHDTGDALPVVPHAHPSVDRPTGRGLLIVAATADDWGVERVGGRPGKTVWAELYRRPSALAEFS